MQPYDISWARFSTWTCIYRRCTWRRSDTNSRLSFHARLWITESNFSSFAIFMSDGLPGITFKSCSLFILLCCTLYGTLPMPSSPSCLLWSWTVSIIVSKCSESTPDRTILSPIQLSMEWDPTQPCFYTASPKIYLLSTIQSMFWIFLTSHISIKVYSFIFCLVLFFLFPSTLSYWNLQPLLQK